MIRSKLIKLQLRHDNNLDVYVGDESNGADRLIRECCDDLGIPRQVFYADWKAHGRAAGPIRNKQMRDTALYPGLVGGVVRACIAFRSAGVSRGTDGMCRLAREADIPVVVYTAAPQGAARPEQD
jgi:hypothetical protein